MTFIDNADLKAQYGNDVFAPSHLCAPWFAVGSKVDFELGINDKGQPQASNVRASTSKGLAKQGGSEDSIETWSKQSNSELRAKLVRLQSKQSSASPTASPAYRGVLLEVGRHFAFIDSTAAKEEYGNDVFCPSRLARDYTIGDEVEFDLMLNGKGQPQASNLRTPGSQQLPQPPSQPPPRKLIKAQHSQTGRGKDKDYKATFTGDVASGTIKAIGWNHAFITSPATEDMFGMDTYCPSHMVAGFSVGEEIIFDLMLNLKGQPQASNVRKAGWSTPKPPKSALPAEPALDEGPPSDGLDDQSSQDSGLITFSGQILEIGKKMAFIDNPEIKEQYGNDVFYPSDRLAGFSVGDFVRFELTVNARGQPQARHVHASSPDATDRYAPY